MTKLAKYPLLDEAQEIVRDSRLSPADLLGDAFVDRHQNAMNRIAASARLQPLPPFRLPVHAVFDLVVAGLLLQTAAARHTARLYARAEARRMELHLQADLKADPAAACDIIRQLTSAGSHGPAVQIKPAWDGRLHLLGVASYLRYAANLDLFRDTRWKLVNQSVGGGHVHLTGRDLARLCGFGIAARIEAGIGRITPPPVTGHVRPYLERIRKIEQRIAPKAIPDRRPGNAGTPPCIAHIMEALRNGEHVPHTGRLMLAAFLSKRGHGADAICAHYRAAPNYSERVTRAQIRSVQNGGLMPYGCPKAASLGLCRRIRACGTIRNPLQFREVGAR